MKDQNQKDLMKLIKNLAELKSIELNVSNDEKRLFDEICKQTKQLIYQLKKKHNID